ncbi:hypothetical protein JG687_00013653 [Phytophthora cactorum]|uniref:Uncharacterized protein n=1 Tax=Phytophthora cactorum TaxID=29920 RepID=A0A8T1U0R0_9STRA|nr:hypothetical protein JG687_00013653 [Phytophthora cactorum]
MPRGWTRSMVSKSLNGTRRRLLYLQQHAIKFASKPIRGAKRKRTTNVVSLLQARFPYRELQTQPWNLSLETLETIFCSTR